MIAADDDTINIQKPITEVDFEVRQYEHPKL